MNLFILCAMVLNSFIPSAQILSDNQTSTTLEFTLPAYTIDNIIVDGNVYDQIKIPGAVTYLEKGLPELPRLYQSIIISDDGEYSYQILSAVYETLAVNTVLPSKGNLTRDIDPAQVPYEFDVFYEEDRYFPDHNINISEPFILRDFRGLTVHLNPFQFNPALNQLIVCKNMQVRIFRTGPGGLNLKFRDNNAVLVTREFKDLYENFFLNFYATRYDSILERAGRMLIISGDQFYPNILPFAEWKRMKGIPVKIKKYSEIGVGHTAVKNYIQSEYNLGNLVWILIVGDSADVPPARTVGITTNASADPVYTYLNGTDFYPDAFISRFSGNSAADINNQVNRTITYERTLVTGDGWESKGMGIASTDVGGGQPYADSTRANWLRNMLLGYNYTSVDRVYAPFATTAMITNGLNEGRSVVNYIGHGSTTTWVTTGFSNTNVNQLNNVNKLPFIISVACVNGNFGSTTCFGEA